MPTDNRNLCILALEAIDLGISFPDVEYFDPLVLAACDEPVAIDWVPSHLIDCIVVSRDRVHSFAATSRIPNLDVVVLASCNDERLCWVPVT